MDTFKNLLWIGFYFGIAYIIINKFIFPSPEKILRSKAKKEAEALRIKTDKEAAIKGMQKVIELATEEMTAKPCPFMEGSCKQCCVHFKAGYYVYEDFDQEYTYKHIELPKCKLWGRC